MAAELQHDAEGFLTGSPVSLKRATDTLRAIKEDVSLIRKALAGNTGLEKPAQQNLPSAGRGKERVGIPKTEEIAAPLQKTSGQETVAPKDKPSKKKREGIALPDRDKRGRFFKKDKPENNPKNQYDHPDSDGGKESDSQLARNIGQAVVEASRNSEKLDPAVEAMNEIAAPISRGIEIFSKDKDKERDDNDKRRDSLLRRIYQSITKRFRKQESEFKKAEKRLKGIEEKPNGEKKGGLLGFLLPFLSKIPILGAVIAGLAKFLPKLMGFFSKGAGGKGWLGGLLKGGGKLLKRVPFLGVALSTLGAAMDISESESDETLTRREKDQKAGKAVGGAVGGIGGMMAGAALGASLGSVIPVVGTAIGGAIGGVAGWFFGEKAGDVLGETVGGWVNDLRGADIPGKLKAGWETVVTGFKFVQGVIGDGWGLVKGQFSRASEAVKAGWALVTEPFKKALLSIQSVLEKVNGIFTAAYEKIKEIPFFGDAHKALEEAAGKIKEAVKDNVRKAFDFVKDKANATVNAAKEKIGSGKKAAAYAEKKWGDAKETKLAKGVQTTADIAQKGYQPAKGWVAGEAPIRRLVSSEGKTRVVETADGSIEKREGGTVSWRNHNPGNLKFEYAGSADKTVSSKRSKEQALKDAQKRYQGVVGLDQFGNAVFESADSGRAAQAQLLKQSHGHKTIEEMLPKYAVSDYSGAAHHAAYASAIYRTAEAQGVDLRGKKIGELTEPEMSALLDGMKKVEGYKAGTVTTLKPGTPQTTQIAHAGPAVSNSFAAPAPAVVASVSTPKVSAAPPALAMAAVPSTPLAQTPSGTGGAQKTAAPPTPKPDAGQDVRDRRIAHVVTGGLSA